MVIIMNYLSEQEFDTQMEKIKKKNESIERKRKLKEEKNKYGFKLKLPSTSKLIVLAVFLMCIEILIYTQYAVIVTGDTSALITLLGIPVTLVPTLFSYYSKAKAENTASGIVYEKTMYELTQQNAFEDESVG